MVYLIVSPRIYTMSEPWMDQLERDIDDMMAERDWQGTISWDEVVSLPRGLVLEGKASAFSKDAVEEELRRQLGGTYANGTAKYRLNYVGTWRVYHQCSCGNIMCKSCIIPSILEYHGTMLHKGLQLDELFLQEEPMSLLQAKAWWAQRTKYQVTISTSAITVVLVRKWSDFCTFPLGHRLRGTIAKGKELETLQLHFGAKYPSGMPKYRFSEDSVQLQCPCGNIFCDKHIFPATVDIHASFPLVLKLREKTIQFGITFRRLDPVTKQEAKEWFESVPLKWKVTVGDNIQLQMICKCKQPHDIVPCRVKLHNCVVCHAKFKKADMNGKMCQDCHHKEIIDCPHCSRRVPRGHYDCKPLNNSHYQQEVTGIYPPLLRRKLGKKGICLDCGEVLSYTVYARHQYRRHHGVKPGNGYSRDYKLHKCTYCNFTKYEIEGVHNHEKTHILIRQHPCRHSCGQAFTSHAAEVAHCKKAHEGKGLNSVSTRVKRVGNVLKSIEKKQKH